MGPAEHSGQTGEGRRQFGADSEVGKREVGSGVITPPESEIEIEGVDSFLVRLNPNPLMSVPLNVNGQLVIGILDTGSQINIISQSALEKLQAEPEMLNNEIVLQLADGSTRKTRHGASLTIGMGTHTTFGTNFAIVPSFPHELLLGLEFMQAHDVTIQTKDRTVWIDGFRFPLPANSPGIGPSACFVELAINIPARTQVLVHLKRFESEDEMVLCEGTETALSSGLLVAPTLCRSVNSMVCVVVANPTSVSIPIIPGTVLAQADTVQEAEDEKISIPVLNVSANSDTNQQKRLLNITDLDVGTELSEEQKAKLLELIHSYDDIMSKHESDTGLTDVMQHTINTGDAAPINQRPYRLSFSERSDVQKLVTEYIDAGFIQESDSPWACPIVIVRKKDGTLRFCCDWRKLNSVTRKDAMPLPRIDDMIDRLGKATVYTKLDFTSGYYQVPLDVESREKTAFVTPDGHFEWRVMGMGLTNAPATFQKLMYKVLGGLLWTNAMAYLDDIVVFSKDFDQHLVDLTKVFDRIRKCKLKIKPPKCSFAKAGIHYLGFVITPRGVECDPETTARVENFDIPRNKKDVRSFLGLTSYYRKFIRNYANIAKPLHNITHHDSAFEWTSECQEAFEKLKGILISPPILAFPNFEKPFVLATDASGVGIGAVLKQKGDDGKERVVAYASRVLDDAERKYFPIERECLALKWACHVFRPYLFGTTFEVHTDHKPLTELKKSSVNNEKLQRFRNALLGFDYDIKYKPGKKNGDADAMSRYGMPTGKDPEDDSGDTLTAVDMSEQKRKRDEEHSKYGIAPENIITWQKKTEPLRYPVNGPECHNDDENPKSHMTTRSKSAAIMNQNQNQVAPESESHSSKHRPAPKPEKTELEKANLEMELHFAEVGMSGMEAKEPKSDDRKKDSRKQKGILKSTEHVKPSKPKTEADFDTVIDERLEEARRNSRNSETPKRKLQSVVNYIRPTLLHALSSESEYTDTDSGSETNSISTGSSDETDTLDTCSSDDMLKPAPSKRLKGVQTKRAKTRVQPKCAKKVQTKRATNHVPRKRAKSDRGATSNWGASESVTVRTYTGDPSADWLNKRRVRFTEIRKSSRDPDHQPVGLTISTHNNTASDMPKAADVSGM